MTMQTDDTRPVEALTENGEKGIFATFLEDPSVLPATVAQQVFSIVPGIFGGIGGFILAARLANARQVKTKGVLIASVGLAALTLGAIFLIVESDEFETETRAA